MTRKDCFDRQTLRAVAAGRCPKERLAAVQRHLARCSRCRAAVVAAAAGVRGPDETVVLKRSSRVVSRISKALLVAGSVAAVGAAWRYTVASKPPELTAAASLQPPSAPDMPGAETPHPSTVAWPETSTLVQDPAMEKPFELRVAPRRDSTKGASPVASSTTERRRRQRATELPVQEREEDHSRTTAPAAVTTVGSVRGDRVIRTTLEC